MSIFHSPQYYNVQPAQTSQFSLWQCRCSRSPLPVESVQVSGWALSCRSLSEGHRDHKWSLMSLSQSLWALKRRGWEGRVCRVSVLYLFTPKHPSPSNFPPLFSHLVFPPFCLSLLLILLSLHHPIPHYQSWPNADLNPLTSQLHYPLQPFLHIHPRRGASFPLFANPPKAQSSNPPQNIDLPNLCHIYHLSLYMISFSIKCGGFWIWGENLMGGNEALDGGGKLFVPLFFF